MNEARRDPNDTELERAIDRAVHAMTDADADPAFRARVLARLERPRGRLAMPVVWRWIGAAAVAAAGIVAWISWAPGPPVPVAGPIVDRPAESNGPGIVPEPGTRIAKPAPAFRADSSRPRRRPVGREHSATPPDPAIALPGQPLPVEVTAMREIEPIAVVAVEGSNIEPDAIAVAALKPIGELEVEQLFAPTRRD